MTLIMAKDKNTTPLPDFETPPVHEVVFSVQFKAIEEFQAPHVGILWEKLGKDKYPKHKQTNFLAHMLEEESGTEQTLGVLPVGNIPPLPRVFFISSDEHELIQVQTDRFVRNWKKVKPEDLYPRYKTLLPEFEKTLESFEGFISDEFEGKTLDIDQYELTYLNHIYIDENELSQIKLSKYFSVFSENEHGSFLPFPEGAACEMVYKLPNVWGRLHATLSQGHDLEGKGLFVLNMTARGINEPQDMKSWLEVAHEWIVRGFADITSKQVQQEIWRRK